MATQLLKYFLRSQSDVYWQVFFKKFKTHSTSIRTIRVASSGIPLIPVLRHAETYIKFTCVQFPLLTVQISLLAATFSVFVTVFTRIALAGVTEFLFQRVFHATLFRIRYRFSATGFSRVQSLFCRILIPTLFESKTTTFYRASGSASCTPSK